MRTKPLFTRMQEQYKGTNCSYSFLTKGTQTSLNWGQQFLSWSVLSFFRPLHNCDLIANYLLLLLPDHCTFFQKLVLQKTELKAGSLKGIFGRNTLIWINNDVKESGQVNQENQQFWRSLIQRSPPMVTCLGQLLACCQARQWCTDWLQDKAQWGEGRPNLLKRSQLQINLFGTDSEQVCTTRLCRIPHSPQRHTPALILQLPARFQKATNSL